MSREKLRRAINAGLIAGVVAVSISAIGMVESFNERDVITDLLTLGQVLLYSTPLIGGYLAVDPEEGTKSGPALIYGLVVGVITAIPLIGLIFLTILFPNIRDSLVNVSPTLIDILTFGQGPVLGSVLLLIFMAILGMAGALFHLMPKKLARPILVGVLTVVTVGTFSGVIQLIRVVSWLPRPIIRAIFGGNGIWIWTAAVVFAVTAASTAWWGGRGSKSYQKRRAAMSEAQAKRWRRSGIITAVLLALIFPLVFGPYHSEVLDVVGIFAIMGLGLNIVVGFAGLLDLGYVAFLP